MLLSDWSDSNLDRLLETAYVIMKYGSLTQMLFIPAENSINDFTLMDNDYSEQRY